jgi:hypothetical protein
MSLRFDHAIILVHDLEQGIAHYKQQGFNPFFGGVHAGGKTHNALIVFSDGSYLELLAPTSPTLLDNIDQNDRTSFLFLLAQGAGLGGYALLSDDLAADFAAMQKRGLGIDLKPTNGRARPDGQQLRWRSAVRDNGSMTPFFLQDETPRNLRVPDDTDTTTQPNGIKGISGLSIAVADLAVGVREYEMMTGIQSVSIDHQSAHLSLEGVELSLVLQPKLDVEAKLNDIQLIDGDNQPVSIKGFLV